MEKKIISRERVSIVLDYGYVKGVHENGSTVLFPAVLNQLASTSSGQLGTQQYQSRVKVRNEYYDIGNASMSSGGIRIFQDETVVPLSLNVAIGSAVHRLIEHNEPVDLVVGLPMQVYSAQREEISEALNNYSMEMSIDGITKLISFNHVIVVPEIVGLYYFAIHNMDGSVKDSRLINQPVGVVHSEYRSLELLYMVRDTEGLLMSNELSGSEQPGLRDVDLEMQIQVTNLIKAKANILEIEKALSWYDGEFDHAGKTYDIRGIQKDLHEVHVLKIKDVIERKWGAEINSLQAIFIDESELMAAGLIGSFPSVKRLENNNFVSAYGCLAVQALAMKASAPIEAVVSKE